MRFTNVCTRQITDICAIIKHPPKKRVLNYFALEMVAFVVARRRHRREQRARGRRERIFSTPHVLIYLECQKNTFSESEHILPLICTALVIMEMSYVAFLSVVSKSPAEMSTPIGDVLELRSRANLPCLVKLALIMLQKIVKTGVMMLKI